MSVFRSIVLVVLAYIASASAGNVLSTLGRVSSFWTTNAASSYLIVTNDMRDAHVPGNIRAMDLAKALKSAGNEVVFVSKNAAFAAQFTAEIEGMGIEAHSP